jgi:hypothetical protein
MDFSAIVGPALATVGPWGLLILTVAAVLTAFIKGALVSGSSVERTEARYQAELTRITTAGETERTRLVALWEARLNESRQREQDWRAAFERSEERADLLASQTEKLMTYAQTTDQFLRSLPRGGTQ